MWQYDWHNYEANTLEYMDSTTLEMMQSSICTVNTRKEQISLNVLMTGGTSSSCDVDTNPNLLSM